MDRISRRSQVEKSIQFGNLRTASPYFADDVVLLTSINCDLQFAAECEVARMRVSTSKSEGMVLCQKMIDCSRVGVVLLPQGNYHKNFRILVTSDGKMECEIDR